ncbi:hypothetical protein CYY_008916 [Polysphondylium violaceum]|uniref:SNF7 family protein n=1 Tax=Polysphondylium violaceum TaxID=133409 RepID=A0A8J4V3G7_9MYCE|nr:hypothetical protein CYY_008916 [Polysphondylium violaceum]
MNLFNNKKDPNKELKESKRELTKSSREMDREINRLRIVEKDYLKQIKSLALANRMDEAKRLTRDLVKLREQIERLQSTKTTMSAVSTKTTTIASQQKMAKAMENATKAMSLANAQYDVAKLQKTMNEYQKQVYHADLSEEMLHDMFEDEEMDQEADDILSKVVDEVVLDNYSKMPSVRDGSLPTAIESSSSKREVSDDEIERMLSSLRG